MQITPDALHALRVHSHLHERPMAPQKRRKKDDRIDTGYTFIKPCYRSNRLYAMYTNADGRALRTTSQTKFVDELDVAIKEVIELLRESHYAEINGEMVLASEHHLDMFVDA